MCSSTLNFSAGECHTSSYCVDLREKVQRLYEICCVHLPICTVDTAAHIVRKVNMPGYKTGISAGVRPINGGPR